MSDLESFSGAAGHSGGILKAENGNLLKVSFLFQRKLIFILIIILFNFFRLCQIF